MKKDFLERPETIKKLWIFLYVCCALTVIPEFFVQRHVYFGVDGFFGFYAVLGFLSCVVLILVAKLGGLFLKKSPDYYQRMREKILKDAPAKGGFGRS